MNRNLYSLFSVPDSSGFNAKTTVVDSFSKVQTEYFNNKPKIFPSFCLGDFYLFEIGLNDNIKYVPEPFTHKLIGYLYLLTKCTISVKPFGVLSISRRNSYDSNQLKTNRLRTFEDYFGDYGFEDEFSDRSLVILKGLDDNELEQKESKENANNNLSNDDNNVNSKIRIENILNRKKKNDDFDEFIRGLDNQTIETFDVADLISEYPYNKIGRDELIEYMVKYINSEGGLPSIDSIQPVKWYYQSCSRQFVSYFYLKDMDSVLKFSFFLRPGEKQMVLSRSNFEIKLNPDGKYFLGSYNRVINMNRFRFISIGKVRRLFNEPFKSLVNDLNNPKIKHILLDGNVKNKFNIVLKLLKTLNHNLPSSSNNNNSNNNNNNSQNYPSENPSLNCVLDSNHDFIFKMIRVSVDSKVQFYIPLVTYIDLRDGKTYLCNNSIPIGANPEVAWPLFNDYYSEFNRKFVSEMYKEAAFFSNHNIEFKDEDILKLLSSYKGLKNFVYNQNNQDKDSLFDCKIKSKSNLFNKDHLEDLKFEKIGSIGKDGKKEKKEYKKVVEMQMNEVEGKHSDNSTNINTSINSNGDSNSSSTNKSSTTTISSNNDTNSSISNNTSSNTNNKSKNKDNNFDMYLVNEKYKMVYKNDGNAIVVNLLLQ